MERAFFASFSEEGGEEEGRSARACQLRVLNFNLLQGSLQ